MWGDKGRQGETRGGKASGRQTHNTGTHVGRMGDKGRQDLDTCGKTMGDNGSLRKADAPSNTGTHVGRQ